MDESGRYTRAYIPTSRKRVFCSELPEALVPDLKPGLILALVAVPTARTRTGARKPGTYNLKYSGMFYMDGKENSST
jgi:hypothetical protein